jgi:hypothetical protein
MGLTASAPVPQAARRRPDCVQEASRELRAEISNSPLHRQTAPAAAADFEPIA